MAVRYIKTPLGHDVYLPNQGNLISLAPALQEIYGSQRLDFVVIPSKEQYPHGPGGWEKTAAEIDADIERYDGSWLEPEQTCDGLLVDDAGLAVPVAPDVEATKQIFLGDNFVFTAIAAGKPSTVLTVTPFGYRGIRSRTHNSIAIGSALEDKVDIINRHFTRPRTR